MHMTESKKSHSTFVLPDLAMPNDKKRRITYHKSQLKNELEKRSPGLTEWFSTLSRSSSSVSTSKKKAS